MNNELIGVIEDNNFNVKVQITESGPRGLQGEIGPQGEQGIQGEIGPQGARGPEGPKGDKGDKGDKGIQGIQGEKGLKGDKGDKGDVGERGEKGEKGDPFKYTDFTQAQLLGLKGDKGDKGIQGERGIQGPKGDKGIQGEQGIQGIQGPKGDKGDTGSVDNLTTAHITTALGYTPANTTNEHNHTNKQVIDKFTEVSGEVLYNNQPITNIPDVSGLMPKSNGVLENYREKLVALSGTSTAINLSLANVFTHTLSGNTTYTITNAVNNQAHSFTLILTQTTTVRTLTFPATVKWQGGEIPDLSVASKTYVLTFMTVDGGTNWLGMFGGEF